MIKLTKKYFFLSFIILSFSLIKDGRTESCPGKLKCLDENNNVLGDLNTDACVAHKISKTCIPSTQPGERMKNRKRCRNEVPACVGKDCDPQIYCSDYKEK